MARGQKSTTPPVGAPNPAAPLSGIAGTMFQLSGSSKYDLDKYYTNATDTHGHSASMSQVKVTPSIQAMIKQMVAATPEYKTDGDFFRDAALHRLVYSNNSGRVIDPAIIQRELHEAEMNRMLIEYAAMESYITLARQGIDKCCEMNDWKQLENVLVELEEQAKNEIYPPTLRITLHETIDYGWDTMRTEVTRKSQRR